ncbi:MAG: chaperone modulator CbpM [Syntrophomonadaceae bacterium]|jgi:MerR family transcriptional regulator/heat shock protein HspR|nr:chaperone modulator CbpM [Syntrophomonadaceae bacterium]MDH7498667.1 chaperone modulator CbpM [Syntrophomonadaceae bacterium]
MGSLRIEVRTQVTEWVALEELEFHPDVVKLLEELGALEVRGGYVEAGQVQRVRKMVRLQRALGVNLAGAVVILELLDRIAALEAALEHYQAKE